MSVVCEVPVSDCQYRCHQKISGGQRPFFQLLKEWDFFVWNVVSVINIVCVASVGFVSECCVCPMSSPNGGILLMRV